MRFYMKHNPKTDECREAFEKWYEPNPKWATAALERSNTNPDGYKLMQAQSAWTTWQAAYSTPKADGWQLIEHCPDDLYTALIFGGTYTWDDGYDDEPLLFVTLASRKLGSKEWTSQADGYNKEYYYEPKYFMPLPQPPTQNRKDV